MNRAYLALAAATAMSCGLSTAPAAAATTLDFTGNICGATGSVSCSTDAQIGQNYGDGTGVDVSYRSAAVGTEATYEPFLKYWGTGYGDLTGVVWGGPTPGGFFSEITLTALAGYEISLLGFDGGCYQNRASCQSFPFSVTQIGGSIVSSGSLTPPAGGHDSTAPNTAYSSTGYILRWGPDGYDGGLDNIRFDVRAIATAGNVPEPASWAMMLAGFGLAGASMRRARKTRVNFA